MQDAKTKYPALYKDFEQALKGRVKIDIDEISKDDLYKHIYDNYKKEQKYRADFDIKPFIEELLREVYPDDLERKWQIKKINEDDTLIIRKGFTERYVDNSYTILSKKTSSILKNPIIDLLSPRCQLYEEWLWIFGRFFPTDNNDELVRYYFNFNYNLSNVYILLGFFKELILKLNHKGISFKFKINYEQSEQTADSIVFYVEKYQYLACFEDFQIEYHKIKNVLTNDSTDTPLFTHHIDRGWAFSEEPKTQGENLSFGQFRASKITDSIVKNRKKIIKSPNIDSQIEKAFELFVKDNEDNFDFENFHLNKNSIVQYKKPEKFSTVFFKETHLISNTDAIMILANHLCRNAIWNHYSKEIINEKCSWLTAEKKLDISNNGIMYSIQGCDGSLGEGLMGICLFLAKVYEIYPSTTILNTLKGALNNCIEKNVNLPQHGLFYGQAGMFILYDFIKKIKELNQQKEEIENIIENIKLTHKVNLLVKNNLYATLLGNVIFLIKNDKNDEIKLYAEKLYEITDVSVDNISNKFGLNGLSGLALSYFKLGAYWLEQFDNSIGNPLKDKALDILNLEYQMFLESEEKVNLSLLNGVSGMIYTRLQIIFFYSDGEKSRKIQSQINYLFSKILTEFFGNGKYLKNEFTIDTGILGLIVVMKYYSIKIKDRVLSKNFNPNYIQHYLRDLYEQLIKIQALPAMGVSIDDNGQDSEIIVSEYYNPDLLNGIAGLGFIYLMEDYKFNEDLLQLFD
jgi:hypothetical protein